MTVVNPVRPDSFGRVFGRREFGRCFVNGPVVAGSVVRVSALVAFLAAAAVTRFRFGFRSTLSLMFLAARTGPAEALAIPSSSCSSRMLRGFVKGVPEALEEAACIGGASRSRFLRRIPFPLAPPGPVATSGFSLISARNDFLFAKSSVMPIPVPVFFVLVQRRPVSGPGGAVKD